MAESKDASAARRGVTRFSRAKKKAITVVAKTSKKPSTHRWITHQRQYSTIGQVRMLAPGEARPVEQADGGRGHQENATADVSVRRVL